MIAPPEAVPGQRVERGPYRVRSEQRWDLLLPDGSRAVLGQLLPEVAAEDSVRRRYVYEAERLAALDAPRLAAVLAMGPSPDPRDPNAAPPWRLRASPAGQTAEAWLAARAPVPVARALEVVAAIADAIHEVHAAGAVLRDLEPRGIVLADRGEVWLTDVGLARVDILSTHTASSLVLEGSPYAAPEHLLATVVDTRADVYTLGVILWRALTGTLPYGDGPALLRTHTQLPPLAHLVSDVPSGLDALLAACLDETPARRPSSAREVAEILRGDATLGTRALERVICQACGERMRPGLRLCLSCGKVAVQFEHVEPNDADNYTVLLTKAKEDEEFQRALTCQLETLAAEVPPSLNFLVGDARMYSKEERESLVKLPTPLFRDLSRATAERLAEAMRDAGLTVKLRRTDKPARTKRRGTIAQRVGIAGMVGSVALAAASPWALLALPVGVLTVVVGTIMRSAGSKQLTVPLAWLRAAPAALPASDPLVARVAALLVGARDESLRALIGELAQLVQELADHRAGIAGDTGEAAALALVTEPIEPIVTLIEREVHALRETDAALDSLDEAVIARAIATSCARGEPPSKRAPLLGGLDRLRHLEDTRAVHLQRLLETASLLRQVIALGLDVENPAQLADNYTTMALAALGEGSPPRGE